MLAISQLDFSLSLSLSAPFARGVFVKSAETVEREMVRVIYRTLILSGRAMCNTSDTERYFNLFCYDMCQEKRYSNAECQPPKTELSTLMTHSSICQQLHEHPSWNKLPWQHTRVCRNSP